VFDFDLPFLTYTNASGDRNYMGHDVELRALHRRTDALDYALRTGRDFDVVLDMLDEDGQDVEAYVNQVEENINIIIASQVTPDDLALWAREF
jgi:hypothetical protein